MVAYSFAPRFVEDVSTLRKRQTVRGFRKRHAWPGEAVQLYTAMRTKYCRKLVTPDPICVDLRHILIAIGSSGAVSAIEIEGAPLSADQIEAFAIADGFGSHLADGFAARRMGAFWLKNHGEQPFSGVVIRWKPSDA